MHARACRWRCAIRSCRCRTRRPRRAPPPPRRDAASGRDSCSSRTSASAGRRSTTSQGPSTRSMTVSPGMADAVGERRAALLDRAQFVEQIHQVSSSTPASRSSPSCRSSHELAALVARLRRRALHLAARRPPDRAARHEHDLVHVQPEQIADRGAESLSISASAATVPLGSTTMTTRSGPPGCGSAERHDAAAPHAGQIVDAPTRDPADGTSGR